ncbi:hypothetical protein EDC94DRAFT_625429 [Helicostylum pulchrum]|nr:hypothetical protein EDC94DRAFT_625429 [Helicostylum pulchrum]
MRSWRHRENKGYAYSDRKSAQDHVASVVLGRTKTDGTFKLVHCSSRSTRRKKRKKSQRQNQGELRGNENTRRTIVAYGDASIRGTYRGNTPVPVKQIQRAIARKAIVFTVDEFRTSVTCCNCQRRLNNVTGPLQDCKQKRIKHRIFDSQNRFVEALIAQKEDLFVKTTLSIR